MVALRTPLLVALLLAPALGLVAAPVPKDTTKRLPDTDDAVPTTEADRQKNRATSSNNLKQIGLAVHNFASANQDRLPFDIADKDGKALLSWRVRILAYVEEDGLYRKFKLDEPWNSEHNLTLLEKMPAVFDSPRAKARKGYTVYQGFHGKGAVLSSGLAIAAIPDGTSNTIWCTEATAAVPWTKPADIPFDEDKPLPKFGKAFDEKPLALLCDGSVRYIDLKKVSEKTLKLAILTNDGTPLGADW